MRRAFPLHPFLFALSPVLFLYSHNVASLPVAPGELLLPGALALALALVLLVVLRPFLGTWQKAGVAATVFLVFFFLYGGAFSALSRSQALRELARHWLLIPLGFVFWLLVAWLVGRARKNPAGLTLFLNLAAVAVVLVNVATGLPGFVRNRPGAETRARAGTAARPDYPDIYYIILDGYARADVLKQDYGFDNSEFIRFLRSRGFQVAAKSRPNYAQTYLSLASALNYMQLDSLAAQITPGSASRGPLAGLIEHNRAMAFLKERGYTTVAFASGYTGTEFRDADVFLSPRASLTEFQNILLSTTPLSPLLGLFHRSQYDLYRDLILFQLRTLPDAARARHPVFVFCHTLVAHPPFVFGRNGEKTQPPGTFALTEEGGFVAVDRSRAREEYIEAYCNQIAYLNGRLEETVDRIIKASPRKPVIILAADHGRGSIQHWDAPEPDQVRERMAILNALLLPGDSTSFYDSITPVNTFRVVFDHLFDAGLPLVPDKAYFSTVANPYRLYDVDNPSAFPRAEARGTGTAIVVFRVATSPPGELGIYGRRLANMRLPGANQRVDNIYVRTVSALPGPAEALDLYRGFVRAGELPELGDTSATYSGRGPEQEPILALFFPTPAKR